MSKLMQICFKKLVLLPSSKFSLTHKCLLLNLVTKTNLPLDVGRIAYRSRTSGAGSASWKHLMRSGLPFMHRVYVL